VEGVIELIQHQKRVMILAVLVLVSLSLTACRERPTIYVYNWGDYIDESLISEFEKRENIRVV